MKLLYVFLLLVTGCGMSDRFVSFSDHFPPPVDSDTASFDAAPFDAGADADHDAGSVPEAGGRPEVDGSVPMMGTGGASSTGGSATGGKPPVGGSPGSGGTPGTGGDACVLVAHTSGIGATWQDCVPRGTYNEAQATRACEASGAPECRATNCGVGNLIVCGYNKNYVYGCWGYAGEFAGYAKAQSDSCSGFDWTWG